MLYPISTFITEIQEYQEFNRSEISIFTKKTGLRPKEN